MPSTDAVLRAAVTGHGAARSLTLDRAFQGLPEAAHGGTIVALFDALAAADGERRVSAHYRRRVPLGVPLGLSLGREAHGRTFSLFDRDGTLVVGRVASAARSGGVTETVGPSAGREAKRPADGPTVSVASPLRAAGGARAEEEAEAGADVEGWELPVSRTCFACGVENALGLRVGLKGDDRRVFGTWAPRQELEGGDGMLATVAVTTLLDEAAFWLGALATGESGMTTELAVTLYRAVPFGETVTVVGERAAVRARAEDGRYWDTRATALDAGGRIIAEGAITFVAVRGAARRLVTGLLSMNAPDTLRRVFPAYTR